MADALFLTKSVAERLGIAHQLVAPMSTGVIGQRLPIDRMNAKLQTGQIYQLVGLS